MQTLAMPKAAEAWSLSRQMRALQRANPEKTTVTEIASDCGFWEFGRFSVAYHSLFGESPSTALRRAP
jgi:transcriptional regulator GlxA family with amidase domain